VFIRVRRFLDIRSDLSQTGLTRSFAQDVVSIFAATFMFSIQSRAILNYSIHDIIIIYYLLYILDWIFSVIQPKSRMT